MVSFLWKYVTEVMVDQSFRLNRCQSSVGKNDGYEVGIYISSKQENWIPCSSSTECSEATGNSLCTSFRRSVFVAVTFT